MSQRIAVYLRVSTVRQAEKDLSIPDQRRQARQYCESKGWPIVREYVEAGASATSGKRPEFQKMIQEACSPAHPFDVVLVHSFSRFFRDAIELGVHQRQLEKHGVELISITQDIGNDATAKVVRLIISATDELQSNENAKHTLRGMQENARQGFFNGSSPPFGYRTVVVEYRAEKAKKRLEIEHAEAETVRLIFRLYMEGAGEGPLGIKAIVNYLNKRGIRNRKGKRFSVSFVHTCLKRTDYTGKHYFNRRNSKTRKPKPMEEWEEVPVPVIIDEAMFQAVQEKLRAHNPRNTPPRTVSSPILLSGLAKCAFCGGAMTLRTGKSGQYRYYSCSTSGRKGKTACKGRNVRMDMLDGLVTDQFCTRILKPERMEKILEEVLHRNENEIAEQQESIKTLRKSLRDVEGRIERQLDLWEKEIVDEDILRERMNSLQSEREELIRLIRMSERRLGAPRRASSTREILAFANALESKLRDSGSSLRKRYLRLFVNRIEVDNREVRVFGPKAALLYGLEQPGNFWSAPVPSSVQDWCARHDSNARPSDP